MQKLKIFWDMAIFVLKYNYSKFKENRLQKQILAKQIHWFVE